MKHPVMRGAVCAAVLLLVTLSFAVCGPAASQDANDTARFIAGLQPAPESPLAGMAQKAEWRKHADAMNAGWTRFANSYMAPIQTWSGKQLPASPKTMFYMFGGPDFPHASAFFPGAAVYILSGLEGVGAMPDPATLRPRDLGRSLASLRTSLGYYLKHGYFITSQMGRQLKVGKYAGTLPLLASFLVRMDKTIRTVEFVELSPEGEATPLAPGRHPRGVKITFAGADGLPRLLYYFNTDLSNGGVAKSSFLAFCAKQGTGGSLLKSASYLLHNKGFTTVRDFLLQHSAIIVQDDTGIPLKRFAADEWRLRAFGRYVRPIPVFRGYAQPDMAKLFARRAEPVKFSIGYHLRVEGTGLLVAERLKPLTQ